MADPHTGAAPKVRLVFQDAYQRLKDAVTPEDARTFQSLSLKDVENALRDLERRQGESRCLRNLNRITPFLDGLQRYASAVDTLCNGTPYLPWIWAPVKLMLELTSGCVVPFNQLIDAYKKIAENLPRFDRFSNAFHDDPDFQHVLAIFYADLLDFHRRVYKFIRRRGWSFFFKSSWSGFETRFRGILEDLATHSQLVDREAASLAIVDARETRKAWLEQTEKQEDDRFLSQSKDVLAWLDVTKSEFEQEEELNNLSTRCHEHSCDWVFQNPKVLDWRRRGLTNNVIWLKGKPGSGKSVLCSSIISTLRADKDTLVLYYFCNQSSGQTQCCAILKAIAAQILRKHMDLSPWIYDDYISKASLPTSFVMRAVLEQLLAVVPSTRIILDGLDELDPSAHKAVLTEVMGLTGKNSSTKILFSSRDIIPISRVLGKRATIALNDEQLAISGAIQGFVRSKVEQLRENIEDISTEEDSMTRVEKALVEKADGMFLWVFLVVDTLERIYSISEMLQAVESLPKGLDTVYDRIFAKIENQLDERGKENVTRILEWVAFGYRPLKNFEIQHGIALHRDNPCINDATKQSKEVFNLCKPLLEDGPNSTIRFVHSSVKEYLLKHRSPFIHVMAPHFDIAFACISYLVSGLSLIDPAFTEEQRRMEVAKGFHGLQLYANGYWIDHLFAYIQAAIRAGVAALPPLLLIQLARLQRTHRILMDNIETDEEDESDKVFQSQLSTLVQALERNNGIHQAARGVDSMRKTALAARRKTDTERATKPPDQTTALFSSMHQRYNETAQHLLAADAVDGLTAASLANFKRFYGASAFTCRFHGCPRAAHGFAGAGERAAHESEHVLQYTCKDIACEYSKLGFASARALKQHMADFHPERHSASSRSSKLQQHLRQQRRASDGRLSGSDDEAFFEELPDVPDGLGFPPEYVAVPEKYRKRPEPEEDDGFALSTTHWDGC